MVAAVNPNTRCPICGRLLDAQTEASALPFCSPRCKLADLGRWLDGSYRIAGPEVASEGEAVSGGHSSTEEDG